GRPPHLVRRGPNRRAAAACLPTRTSVSAGYLHPIPPYCFPREAQGATLDWSALLRHEDGHWRPPRAPAPLAPAGCGTVRGERRLPVKGAAAFAPAVLGRGGRTG